MAFTPSFATGFEMGTRPDVSGTGGTFTTGATNIVTGGSVHTGTYAMSLGSNFAYAEYGLALASTTDIYLGAWVILNSNGSFGFNFHLTNGGILYLRMNTSTSTSWTLYYYINNVTTTITSGMLHNNTVYNLIQIRTTATTIETKLNGLSDISISYSMPASFYRVLAYGSGGAGGFGGTIDDFVIGTGGWPEDYRIVALTPNDDTATVQWDNSGATGENYTYVDEKPANDSDYVYTTVNGEKDYYELTDFVAQVGNNTYVPRFTVQWARGWKEPANTQQVKLIQKSGTTEYASAGKDISLVGSPTYVFDVRGVDPDGNPWSDAVLDSLQAGVQAVI